MLFGRDVAEHGGAVPSDHGCADGAGDVVIARSYIGDQWAQGVERSFVAEFDFFFDLLSYFVHGDVAGAFDHDLHVLLPGDFRELAERFEFGELGFVAGVGYAAGAEAVAQRKADVVLFENLDDVFEAFEHDVGAQVFDALHSRDGFIDGHGADGHGRVAQDGFANLVDVAAGREVHDRVGAVVDGGVQLFEFFIYFRRDGRVADVGVDFAQAGHADGHGLELGMVDVSGDDHAPAGDFVADKFRRELFFVGDGAHFFGDHAVSGVMHLRKVSGGVFFLAAAPRLRAGLRDAVPIAAAGFIVAIAIAVAV